MEDITPRPTKLISKHPFSLMEGITPRPGQSILKHQFLMVPQFDDLDDDGHWTDLSEEEEEEADSATTAPSNQKATLITESPNKKAM